MTEQSIRRRRPSSSYSRSVHGDVVANVKVVVRIRPPNAAEQREASSIVVHQINENVLVFDPAEQSKDCDFQKTPRDIRKRRNKDMKFAFDYIFGTNSTNTEVFEQTTKTILDGLLQGYNCSVFAYGATGAGKTHTMLGSAEHPGVVYHTMIDLYQRIANIQDEKTCSVAVSYLEVYNEQIRDLLISHGSAVLPVREDPKLGVVITGLSLHKPKTAEELLHMLQFGNQNRTQHPTDANAESSRSHAVFQVFIRQKEKTANISTEVRVAKMCLVDLAGSERAMVTKNRGSRFREGANINRSLLALGNVINALADNKYKGHIPYRDSKLTRLLKDSLGGNCHTVMIAAVSPSRLSYDDTYNTLKYADRAKHIQATVKKNILSVDFHVSRYGQIVEELRTEIGCLKERVKKYEEGKVVAVGKISCHTEIFRLQDVLYRLFSTRIDIRLEQLSLESSHRDRLLRIYRKEKCLQRLQIMTDTQNGIFSKVQKNIMCTKLKLRDLEKKKEFAAVKFDENTCWLKQVESEILKVGGGQVMPEMLELSLRMHKLEVELGDTRQNVKHLRKLVKVQERDKQTNDRLIMGLLNLVKKQHFILKGHGLMTFDMTSEFDGILQSMERTEVTWADEVTGVSPETEYHIDRVVDLPLLEPLPLKRGTPSRLRRIKQQCLTPGVSNKFLSAHDPELSSPTAVSESGDGLNLQASSTPLKYSTVVAGTPSNRLEFSDRKNRPSSVSQSMTGISQNVASCEKSDSFTCQAGHTPASKKYSLLNVHPVSASEISGLSTTPNVSVTVKAWGTPSVCAEPKIPALVVCKGNDNTETDVKKISTESDSNLNSTFTLEEPKLPSVPVVGEVGNGGKDFSAVKMDNCWTRTVLSSSASPFPAAERQLSCSKPAQGNAARTLSSAQNSHFSSVSISHPLPDSGMAGILSSTSKTNNPAQPVLATQTVTKSAPSGKENTEVGGGESNMKKSVARSINFDSVARTPDRTYAQVVKTPPTPERCPLAPLSSNTPTLSPSVMLKSKLHPEGTPGSKIKERSRFQMNPQVLNQSTHTSGSENVQTLRKLGFPIMSQRSTSRLPGMKPSYMQMTKSSAQRTQKVNNQAESDHIPLFKRRSKSTSSLSHGRWLH